MAVTVTCENPECGIVFEVGNDKIGQTAFCPKCGTPAMVAAPGPAPPAAEAGQQAAAPAGGADKGLMLPPTKQQCPNCGVVIGADLTVCPECGAATRVGVGAGAGRRRGPDLAPFLIGGGILVALAVLVGLIVFAVRLLGERGLLAEEEAKPAAEKPAPAAVEKPKPAAPRYRVPEELLAELTRQEEQARQAVTAYRERLSQVLQGARRDSLRDMAAQWADLYVFCRDSGLESEADQCWHRAAMLAPDDPEVNAKLGRTERFAGHAVTPEQKQFLESLRPLVRIVNRDPRLSEHEVSVGGGPAQALGWSDRPEFPVDAGPVRISVRPRSGEGTSLDFSLTVDQRLVYTVTLQQPAAAPELGFNTMSQLYAAVGQGLVVENVSVERNWQGNVTSATGGGLRLTAPEGQPLTMQLSRQGDTLTVAGTVTRGNAFRPGGQQVLQPGHEEPLRLAIDAAAESVSFASGTCYTLNMDLLDGVWGVLGTAQGEMADEWARRRLAEHLEEVKLGLVEREASGVFAGPWQTRAHGAEKMAAFQQIVGRDRVQQDWASRRPDYADSARLLSVEDRQQRLYLNWPRFRHALTAVTQDCHPAILAQLSLMTTESQPEPEQPRVPRVGRGIRRGPPAGYGPPARGGPPAFGRPTPAARAQQDEEASLEPPEVQLNTRESAYARMQIAGLLPDSVAMQEVRGRWGALDQQGRQAAMVTLERVGTPEAVAYLGRLSRESRQQDLLTASLMSLGAIGTPAALEYCEGPAVLPALRAAALAAKAVAGDPDAIAQLPRFVKAADPAARSSLLNFVTAMDTPATLLVLSWAADSYTDAASRKQIATALIRMGGRAAMVELADLMDEAGTIFPDLLARVSDPDMVMLMRRVGQAVVQGKAGEAGISFLTRAGSPLAFAYLKGAALAGDKAALDYMLEQGSAAALEAAMGGADTADLALLKRLRGLWLSEQEGRLVWQERVDPAAGTAFLQRVLRSAKDAKVKLAAAWMLHQSGQSPEIEVLLALAQEPPADLAPEDAGAGPGRAAGRGGRGPTRGRRGPPGGFGGAPAAAAAYRPSRFTDPHGAVALPIGFGLEGSVQRYALGVLSVMEGEEAVAELRRLADHYLSVELKTAVMRTLAGKGGEENIEFLRARATARKDSYERASDLWRELEVRLAALSALGYAKDAEFLPALLDMLHEKAPAESAVRELSDDYADAAGWWEAKIHTGAAKCISDICRHKQLFDLTADGELQRQVVERLVALIERPGPPRGSLSDVHMALKTEAVRAFGRCADPYAPDTRLVLNRVAVQARAPAPRSTSRRSTRIPAYARGMRGVPAEQEEEEAPASALRAAFVDAVATLAVRGGGLGLLREMPGILPGEGQTSSLWSSIMFRMSGAPTSEYFSLLSTVYDSIEPEMRRRIYDGVRGRASRYDLGYAQFAAKVVKAEMRKAEEPEEERGPRGRGGPPRVTPVAAPPGVAERGARMRERAIAQARGRAPRGRAGTPLGRPAPGAPGGAPPPGQGVSYARYGPRRFSDWSYSVAALIQSAAADEEVLDRSLELLKDAPTSVLVALGAADVAGVPTYGPAVATICAQGAPSIRSQVVQGLDQVLVGAAEAAPSVRAPGPGFSPMGVSTASPRREEASAETKRAAVSALRRIGGEEAAQALLDALVGPEGREAARAAGPPTVLGRGRPPGVPPGARIPTLRGGAGGRGGPFGPRGLAASPPALPVTAFLASRALGAMGRDDLLRLALNAHGRQFFDGDPESVQKAALHGMAYLPSEKGPLQILEELLGLAQGAGLRKAVADAMYRLLERLAGV